MFGRSLLARFSQNARHAALRERLSRTPPRVADAEEIDARLDAFVAHMIELTEAGDDVADLERTLADACARIEEWTA